LTSHYVQPQSANISYNKLEQEEEDTWMKLKFLTNVAAILLLMTGCSANNENTSESINDKTSETEQQRTTQAENKATAQTEENKDIENDDKEEASTNKEDNKQVEDDGDNQKSQPEQSKEPATEVKEEEYTKESYTAYKKAVETAKEVQANEQATQAEVDEAVKNVEEAKKSLEKKKNKEEQNKKEDPATQGEQTVTISTSEALAANDIAFSLGAIEYTVKGTIPSIHKGKVTELTLTYIDGKNKKEQAVKVTDDGTFSHVIPADEFATWKEVQASYEYKKEKQESSVQTLTPKVKES